MLSSLKSSRSSRTTPSRTSSGPPSGLRRSRRTTAAGLLLGLVGASVAAPGTGGTARADVLYVPWSGFLTGWTATYSPTSANDCVAGRRACVGQAVNELNRVLQETGKSCGHHAVFALAYTRMTQSYAWSIEQPGYYLDVPFANHQDAVFAKYYTDAWTAWRRGDRAAVPESWRIAFDAAAARTVSGTGDLLLGMNAHINRDLPFVLASVGLVAPDGTSRKRDFDAVEDFLAEAAEPLIAEASQRFAPSMDDNHDPLDATYTAYMQMVSVQRENAWRNAEALVNAPTPEARALVAARIEAEATANAQALLLANRQVASSTRDTYCAAHHGDTAPMPYPFGTPAPYRA